ncbi:MAG: hypothetical protein LBI53_08305 [Candidatus Peribacteria bacterium]|nr:hypothetical protein [Candidatus Peribacteria bacterium]
MKHGTEKIDKVYSGVASWLKSQLLLCVIIATMTYAGLRILALIGFNLPQKGVLILIIGLLEVVPYL